MADTVSKATQWARDNRERKRAINKRSYHRRTKEDITVVYRRMLSSIKNRAGRFDIPFDLTIADLPPVPAACPALGIPLERGRMNSPNQPELDRAIPALGYVAGNVSWLSRKANHIKGSATHDEITAVGEWLRERTRSEPTAP